MKVLSVPGNADVLVDLDLPYLSCRRGRQRSQRISGQPKVLSVPLFNIVNLMLEGKGVQVEITRPREASWKRSGEVIKHRNGDIERATATTEKNGITYVIRALRQ